MSNEAAAKTPQLENQTGLLSKALEDAAVVMTDLENRLSSVTKEMAPDNKTADNTEESGLVSAAAYVRDQRYKVEDLTGRARGLIKRLEV